MKNVKLLIFLVILHFAIVFLEARPVQKSAKSTPAVNSGQMQYFGEAFFTPFRTWMGCVSKSSHGPFGLLYTPIAACTCAFTAIVKQPMWQQIFGGSH